MPFMSRQVDHQPVVHQAQAGAVMPSAANGDGKLVIAPEVDRRDDIGYIDTACDQSRALIDHAVVDLACCIIFRVVGADQLPA